jgi:hypothetical protein
MKKIIFISHFLMIAAISFSAQGQNLKQDTLFMPDQFRQYQFQLDEPVKSIDELRYEQSGEKDKRHSFARWITCGDGKLQERSTCEVKS